MPKYLIEREIPDAGRMSAAELSGASAKSCSVLNKLGGDIQWIHSYVTGDKIYCVYTAPTEELIEQHARESGFPANKISEVKAMIDPTRAA
ncbi:MAG: DUF4242 domain-containing protein [Pyrinomonadaceae bacterium]|nr:DUF4242 domain-containing protein [Acidobacteriota bacterium]